ncbi:MAG TPA: CocE/NonD family hydrolase [Thermoanaerobaculia bacterium]|nr:CocE/NonD family hydrolase [Thermoanaerobaculia bacterium]
MNGLRPSIAAATFLALAAPAFPADEPPNGSKVEMQWAVKIPMRDGVALNATIYRPAGQKEDLPAVFTLTPYIGDSYLDRAFYFASHGYVFALVDVRGRGNSGGVFEPFANDGRDGYDVVEWLAKQPGCNGKVAMWGGSYAGFDQWSVAKEFPPHLSTIVPAAAAHPGIDFPFQYNIFAPYDLQWLSFTSGVTGNGNLFGASGFWAAKAREYYNGHTAFKDFDRIVGNSSTVFQKWIEHPATDAYYDAMVPTTENYARLALPILTITGHYDGDQPGAFTYYRRHMEHGTAAAKESHYLIIGPWDHAGTRTPKADVGGLHFGPASVLDLNGLHREWYDWTMKGGAKPAFLKKRVAYYVVGPGAEEWKYADTLESIANKSRVLYLSSAGAAGDLFHSGSLADKSGAGAAADHWTYDPMDTRPGALELDDDPAGLVSQRALQDLLGNGAVYHSDPLPEAAEVSGFPKLTVWLSMDVPDTDLEAALYEILPDGGSVFLTGATMRARYRESLREAKPVTPGKAEKYVFDNFTFFSRRVSKGSRLRLLVHCPNTIGAEKNYNSGGVVANETGKDARVAHVTLLHDAAHPSALELPVVAP